MRISDWSSDVCSSDLEFHYLHHAPGGAPYADPAETSAAIVDAAAESGIALTLLPVLYAHAGFGAQPPTPAQARFVHDLDGYARLLAGAAAQPARGVGRATGGADRKSTRLNSSH